MTSEIHTCSVHTTTELHLQPCRTLYEVRKLTLSIELLIFSQLFHFYLDFNMTYFSKHKFIFCTFFFQAVLNADLAFFHYLLPNPSPQNCFTKILLNYMQGVIMLCHSPPQALICVGSSLSNILCYFLLLVIQVWAKNFYSKGFPQFPRLVSMVFFCSFIVSYVYPDQIIIHHNVINYFLPLSTRSLRERTIFFLNH